MNPCPGDFVNLLLSLRVTFPRGEVNYCIDKLRNQKSITEYKIMLICCVIMNKNTDQKFLCVNLSLVCHGNRLVLQQNDRPKISAFDVSHFCLPPHPKPVKMSEEYRSIHYSAV